MNPRAVSWAIPLFFAACLCGLPASAQPVPMVDPTLASRDALLAELGLLRPLAASLRWQLSRTSGESRKALAEQLGALYAKMLKVNPPPAERMALEQHCRELLELVPEAATPALRLSLAVAQYLPVENLVERRDLLLATSEEVSEAQRVLAEVTPLMERISREIITRVAALEERDGRGTLSDEESRRIRAELADARELRSEAAFRAGWACLYSALLSDEPPKARKAMDHFGIILGALPGRPATIDRAPLGMLKYDHVGKAAVGCAMASSLLGNHIEAIRWMNELSDATELTKDVAEQLVRRKIRIFAADDRWADIELMIVRQRRLGTDGKAVPLALADARTLAVIGLTSLNRPDFREGLRSPAQRMVQVAMGDLVVRGEVGHVLSLVKSFGTAIIGADGFINNFVRALRAYDEVRAMHQTAEPQNANSPATTAEVLNAYRQVIALFEGCLAAPDAGDHPAQRMQARMCLGLAMHYSGLFEKAAAVLESVYSGSTSEPERREALYDAIVSLSLAIKAGAKNLDTQHERLQLLFIQSFPNSREANQMVRQRTNGGKALTAADIDLLLSVAPDNADYHGSRSVAADALYRQWKATSTPGTRDFAALRYADVSMDLLRREYAQATHSTDTAARSAADIAVNRARRIAEVLLACTSPDMNRSGEVLAMIDTLAKFHSVNLTKIEDELCYRRFQIAFMKQDAGADRELARLRELGGPFVIAAERLMYRRANDEWAASPSDAEAASRLITSGSRVLLHTELAPAGLASVRDRVAAAACARWKLMGDPSMRELALRLDREQVEKGFKTLAGLGRIAELEESLGHHEVASEAWLDVLAAAEEDSDSWYQARIESIRLIAVFDSARATSILDQFKALRPNFGPEPWGERMRTLDAAVRSGQRVSPGGPK